MTYLIIASLVIAISLVLAGWIAREMEMEKEGWVRYESYKMIDRFEDVDYESGTKIEKIERLCDGYPIKIKEFKLFKN